jgi:hypothetical protein
MAVVGDDKLVRNLVRDGIACAATAQHDITLERVACARVFWNDP